MDLKDKVINVIGDSITVGFGTFGRGNFLPI